MSAALNVPNTRFADIKDFLNHASKLGEAEAAGGMKRSEFLVDLAYAVMEGHVNANGEDAGKVWGAFRSKQAKKLAGLVTPDFDTQEKDFKQKKSMVLAVMKAAAMTGVALGRTLEEARPIIVAEKSAGSHKMNTFDSFVAIARAQHSVEGRDLTHEEIKGALLPKTKDGKERTEISSLEALIKAIEVHINGTEGTDDKPGKEAFPSEQAARAVELLRERVTLIEFHVMQAKARAAGLNV